jgi:hypothetical protein
MEEIIKKIEEEIEYLNKISSTPTMFGSKFTIGNNVNPNKYIPGLQRALEIMKEGKHE